ncbi:hypothetical protein [Ignavigranum ruoffiae]|uniref:hypothetical protein n=1 Tax=Ignavigranum ruoffiae TaxID=89093 RepID=UPI0024AD7E37|nr:hypothetical protein [Ignavigranum ruoffiae]
MVNKTLEIIKNIEDEAQAIQESYQKQVAEFQQKLDLKLRNQSETFQTDIQKEALTLEDSLKKESEQAQLDLEKTIEHYQKRSQEAIQEKKDTLTDYIIDRIIQRYS